MMRRLVLPLACAVLALAGCERPEKTAAPAPAAQEPAARERAEPVSWDAGFGAFWYNDAPLNAARLWNFDNGLQGFSGSADLSRDIDGTMLTNRLPDSVIRSPSGLTIDGSRFTLVLVRLTRLSEAPPWDGALTWSTAEHPEAAAFHTKPFLGDAPEVNETVILAYDMANPKRGGDDWTTSLIDQIRIDTDDGAGSRFLLRQIAIVENPDPETLKAPPWPVAPPAPAAGSAAAVGLR